MCKRVGAERLHTVSDAALGDADRAVLCALLRDAPLRVAEHGAPALERALAGARADRRARAGEARGRELRDERRRRRLLRGPHRAEALGAKIAMRARTGQGIVEGSKQ